VEIRTAFRPWWLSLAVVAFGACSPIYYAPNSVNVPMIGGKGEGAVSALRGDHGSLNINAAYSPAPRLGVLLDGYHVTVPDSNGNGGHGTFVEGGAGFYRPIRSRFLADVYGLAGFGRLNNHFSQGIVDANFVRYGVQPSLALRSRIIDLSGAVRLVGVRHYGISGTWTSEVQYLQGAGAQFLVEPVATVRVGYKSLKLQAQLGQTHDFTDPQFKLSDTLSTIGVVYSFRTGRH
jgi:hypothetical protein